jgi:membrane protein
VRRLKRSARLLVDAGTRFDQNDGWAMAGYIAFSGLLAIFPFIIFATTLIGILVGESPSDQIVHALFQIVPSHVALTLEPVVNEVLSKRSGSVLTLSLLFAIWVASNAIEAFRTAFDRAYRVDDRRGLIAGRVVCIAFVFLGAIVSALLGLSIILSPLLIRLASDFAGIRIPGITGWLSYAFGLTVFILFQLLLHRYLPGERLPMRKLWPGVLVTTGLWMIAAWAFSVYLTYTPTYTVTYGALAGVIITLMFFYITGMALIFGAEFNAAISAAGRTPHSAERQE